MKNTISLLFLLLPLLLWGQNTEVKRIDLRQRLSNNFIKGITQDPKGFLWFATEEGLSKLEGAKFRTFLKDEDHPEKSINANELNCVYADEDDPFIWIGTQRDGLCCYNYLTDMFTAYRNKPEETNSLITNDVTSIIPADDGNLWISTYHRGVEYLNKKTGEFTHYNSNTVKGMPDNVWILANGTDGELFIGHLNQGFSILFPNNKQIRNFRHKEGDKNSLPGNEVVSIFKDSNDNLWIGTDKGLSLYNPEKDNFINFRDIPGVPVSLASSYVFSICQVGDNLWMGTEEDGVYYFSIKQRAFMSSEPLMFNHLSSGDENNQLSGPNVPCIYPDSYNNVWLGMWGTGINFVSHNKSLFNVWSYTPNQKIHNCLNARAAWGICADSSDKTWVCTEGGGINLFDEGVRTHVFSKESGELQDNRALTAYQDSQGILWFGFYRGPLYYKDKKNSFHPFPLEDADNLNIRTLYEDDKQQLWIGSQHGVHVVNLNNKSEILNYNTDNSLIPENLVRSLAQDKEHRIWIGTFGRGVGVYSSDMQLIESLNTWTGFCSNRIEHIFKDSQNRMWVATSAGAVLIDSSDLSRFQIFGRKKGLANNHIQAITEDANGNIWLSTNLGISMISHDLKKVSNYFYADGIPLGEFTPGSVTQDSKGNIYFGSNNGVCYFDPFYVSQKHSVPSVIFTKLKIEGTIFTDSLENERPLLGGEKINIGYQQNTFSISFNIQDYSFNGRVEYAYRLKGMNDTWYALGGESVVTFRNLPHGDYLLQVRARLRNQEWSTDISTMPFTINPPLWKSWWAIILYAFLLGGIVIYQFKSYKRKMEWESNYKIEKQSRAKEQQINDERLRFFTNITHELRTPLTLILGPLEDLKKDVTLSKSHAQKVSIIHQSAVRLLKLINQILEFRKTETQNKKLLISKANLSSFIYEIGLKYKELNQNPAVNFHIDIKEKKMCMYFDKEVLTMILDNLISNAIKYTPEGNITLCLEKESDENIAIRISDTGYGISEEAIPHIFERYYQEGSDYQASGTGIGLSLVRNLVQLHGGQIWVESTINKGSDFILTLPVSCTYPDVPHAEEEPEVWESEDKNEVSLEGISSTGNKVLLVVEDNIDIRNYIASSFSEEFEVVTAENGEVGIEKALQFTPDIIVSDIMMPVKNGIELCGMLKKDVRTSHIPIILLTAKDSLEDKEEGYQVGADSYLTKPFSASLLRSRIHNILELRSKLANKVSTVDWSDKKEQVLNSLNQIDNEFIEKITSLIEDDLSSDKIDIGYLAEHLCMSISTLYRKVKALTNLSTNELIRKVKMKNAERMLLEQKYTISEISYRVGINTVSYFRQCFQKEFGMSPTQYLKKIKGITIKDEEE